MLSQFKKLSQFLQQWQLLSHFEPLEKAPEICNQYAHWLHSLTKDSIENILAMENTYGANLDKAHPLYWFYREIRQLIQFKTVDHKNITPLLSNSEKNSLRKLNKKKFHELQRICHLLQEAPPRQIIDVGGGVGQLAQYLWLAYHHQHHTIDCNEKWQQQGIERLKRYLPESLKDIHFTHQFVDGHVGCKVPLLADNLLLSLHGCGDLSVHLINWFDRYPFKKIISVGCCYHKLTSTSGLSAHADIQLNTTALNLAAKTHKIRTLDLFHERDQVKRYRYALHLFLKDQKIIEHFEGIGSSPRGDYLRNFSDYAHPIIQKKYSIKASKKDLQDFYQKPSLQKYLNQLILIGIVRESLGRVVESYITIDRALAIQEKGYHCEILEVFDRNVSPRNLMITAQK